MTELEPRLIECQAFCCAGYLNHVDASKLPAITQLKIAQVSPAREHKVGHMSNVSLNFVSSVLLPAHSGTGPCPKLLPTQGLLLRPAQGQSAAYQPLTGDPAALPWIFSALGFP